MRELKYFQALHEAQSQMLESDPNVLLLGLGVPGPTGIFGTTSGLQERFGANRVIDTPSSENAMTGVALGAAIQGKRPIMVHMRVDFALLAIEPIVNQAAKWHYMYGGKMRAPLVIRMIIGRGWGQGPQHSQSLQSWFGHIPGLKVVMPTRPDDAKGMLISAVRDDAPVLIFEHRWLYNLSGPVPEAPVAQPLEGAKVVRKGRDVTIAATSYMVIEALSAADELTQIGIDAEVIDLRCLTPIDTSTLKKSIIKTGHLVVADTSQSAFGVTSEVIAQVSQHAFYYLKAPPRCVALPHLPTPTTPALADLFYPAPRDISQAVHTMLGATIPLPPAPEKKRTWRDTPDPDFTGPY
ncbi:alpha-ketoacid dehydrogenase subunit beta [Paracoccaceae bacterium]|jgi:acetoin:2,6-dichlorophenolindophenol oxidoreductase subunit beta|nr:alpha-ketoacid dehydrogenase subunit beta [Paracoccaceae bacterium]